MPLTRLRHIFSVAMLAIAMSPAFSVNAGGDAAALSQRTPKHILILNSHSPDLPWQQIVNRSIVATLENSPDLSTKIHTEFTGLAQYGDRAYTEKLAELYRHKYAGRKMDLVISVDNPATNFILDHGKALFPDVPVVLISEEDKIKGLVLRPNMTGLLSEIDVRGTLDLILHLHPNTKQIAVISGSSETDRFYEEKARRVFQTYVDRVKFIDLTDLSMARLMDAGRRLPADTIALYIVTLVDKSKEAFIPKRILPRLSRAINAPLYGLWDTLLGSGIVGGSLSSAEFAGRRVAGMGIDILKGKSPERIPIVSGSNAFMFDWRQLRRWNIDENDLPPGSVVRFREPSLFDLYKWHIIGITGFVLIETLLIFILLLHRARRRQAEKSLQTAHDELEHRVTERTAELTVTNERLRKEVAERMEAQKALADSERRLTDIINFLPDPTWAIDIDGRVIAWNLAMERLTGVDKKEMIGKGDYAYAFPFYDKPRPVLIDFLLHPQEDYEKEYLSINREEEARIISGVAFNPERGKRGQYLAATAAKLFDANGDVVGAIESVRDITKDKLAERERERLIEELKDAIGKVKTLSGMLPICSSCKKIRDDKGYWNQIESYLARHSEIDFSHGLCPECMDKLYGNQPWYKKRK